MNSPMSWFFFSSRRRHTMCSRDWSSDVCSSDLQLPRPAVDLQPLAVADEVRLGGGPDPDPGRAQRGSGEGQHAALAVRAADKRPPQLELRIAECLEECTCPSQAQTDPEPPPLGQRADGVAICRGLVIGRPPGPAQW